MKIVNLLIIYVILVIAVSGCIPNQNKNNINNSQSSNLDTPNNNTIGSSDEVESTVDIGDQNITSSETMQNITQEDFNINYKDIIINDIIPFKQIANSLEIEIGKTDSNVQFKALSDIGNWYVVHYPSKEAEEIRLEYIVNEQLGTQKLVLVDLYNVDTFRGISVGGDLEELLNAYGDAVKPKYNTSTTDWYYYPLDTTTDESYPDKSISIVVDKNSKKVTEISISYYQNGAMEELGFDNFD